MPKAVLQFKERVQVLYTRHGSGRRVFQLEIKIPALAECKTMRRAKSIVQKEAHAALREKYQTRYCLKEARPQAIAATR